MKNTNQNSPNNLHKGNESNRQGGTRKHSQSEQSERGVTKHGQSDRSERSERSERGSTKYGQHEGSKGRASIHEPEEDYE